MAVVTEVPLDEIPVEDLTFDRLVLSSSDRDPDRVDAVLRELQERLPELDQNSMLGQRAQVFRIASDLASSPSSELVRTAAQELLEALREYGYGVDETDDFYTFCTTRGIFPNQ